MAEWFLRLILTNPSLFKGIGNAMMSLGGFLILFGWRGHRVLEVIDRRLARVALEGPTTLAELYPTLPTWWIPETSIGFVAAFLVALLGGLLAWYSKQLERLTR